MIRFSVPFAILLTACTTAQPAGVAVTGQWGGPHVGLTLTETGGELVYDCASGRIAEPLVPDAGGRFAASGSHAPGHGGPDVVGQVPTTYPTRFNGAVRGDRMTLTGRVDNGVLLGPFDLRRGAEAGIFRCL